MNTLTLKHDTDLSHLGNFYAKAGTKVKIKTSSIKMEGFTLVSIEKAYTWDDDEIEINDCKWFENSSFIELQ
jgi:hypothetical protein